MGEDSGLVGAGGAKARELVAVEVGGGAAGGMGGEAPMPTLYPRQHCGLAKLTVLVYNELTVLNSLELVAIRFGSGCGRLQGGKKRLLPRMLR